MFRIAQRGSIKYYECRAAGELDFALHAFCTRQGGVSGGVFAGLNVSVREGDSNDHILRNLELIAAAFGLTASQFLPVHQVHQDGIWVITGDTPIYTHDPPPRCDAVVTDRRQLALCIKTADCVPVLLADPARRIIGAVHAGWKGTALKIAAKTVAIMAERFGTRPSDLIAAVGPAIGPCCYEIDACVYQAMSHHPPGDAIFHTGKKDGRWMLDLPLANRHQLLRSGLLPERIWEADACTACQRNLFFSHRAQAGHTGRQLNFIMIR